MNSEPFEAALDILKRVLGDSKARTAGPWMMIKSNE